MAYVETTVFEKAGVRQPIIVLKLHKEAPYKWQFGQRKARIMVMHEKVIDQFASNEPITKTQTRWVGEYMGHDTLFMREKPNDAMTVKFGRTKAKLWVACRDAVKAFADASPEDLMRGDVDE